MQTFSPLDTERGAIETAWWLVLLEGIALAVLGLLLVISPGITTVILIQFLGFYWMISGIFGIVSIFHDRTMWGWKLFYSVISILAGLSVIRNPLWSAILIPALVVIFLAASALINGVIKCVQFIRNGNVGTLVLGIVNILLAILLFSSPLVGALVLPIVVGVLALIGGIATIIMAFRVRRAEESYHAPPPPMPAT